MNNKVKHVSYLREPQVFDLTKLSKSTRWRLERDNKFPRRRKLSSRSVGWLLNEIESWMESRKYADGEASHE